MPIDVSKALGAELPASTFSWDEDDVILYHLGLGAGDPPTDETELRYIYELELQVVPSYAVIPPLEALMAMASVEGMEFDPMQLLHGEQDLTVHRPLPTSAQVTNHGRIAEIWDKGKGALVVVEVDTVDQGGEKLATNRFSAFIRGEGGFGGDSGPKASSAVPGREPDHTFERKTLPQQAALYRLSGDKNPLHIDPGMAAFGGFDRPILHGLCTYGIVCKGVIDELLDGDVTKVARFQVRFAGSVYPGDTIAVRTWTEGDRIHLEASVPERDTIVLSNASITVAR